MESNALKFSSDIFFLSIFIKRKIYTLCVSLKNECSKGGKREEKKFKYIENVCWSLKTVNYLTRRGKNLLQKICLLAQFIINLVETFHMRDKKNYNFAIGMSLCK